METLIKSLVRALCMLYPMMQQNVFVWPLPSDFLCAWRLRSHSLLLCVWEPVMFSGGAVHILLALNILC